MWIGLIFLSGMKAYRRIVWTLAKGYLLGIGVGLAAVGWKLNGLLLGVLTGHSYLLFSFLHHIVREYPGSALLKFDFLDRNRSFYSLFAVGTLYYLAVWVDKLIFWFIPYTSEAVIGPLRASIIYDLPIFLAYLFILPGMAVFLVTMEADFAEQHERFYRAVREGDTLMHIEHRRDRMVYAARQGIYEIFKVQGLTVVLCLLWGRDLLHAVGISPLYIHSVLHRCCRRQCPSAADGDTQRAFLSRRAQGSVDHNCLLFHNKPSVHLRYPAARARRHSATALPSP